MRIFVTSANGKKRVEVALIDVAGWATQGYTVKKEDFEVLKREDQKKFVLKALDDGKKVFEANKAATS